MLLSKNVPLSEAKPGQVYRINYGKNNSRGELCRTGKVVSVRDTKHSPVRYSTRFKNRIDRSRMLVTVMENGGKCRRFYAEQVANCAKRLTLLGRLWLWVCGVRFQVAA